MKLSYRPVDSKLILLPGNRDKLPSGKQIMALTLMLVPNSFPNYFYSD